MSLVFDFALRQRAAGAMPEHFLRSFYYDGRVFKQALNCNESDSENLRLFGRMLGDDYRPVRLAAHASRLALHDRLVVALRTPVGRLLVIGIHKLNPPASLRSTAVLDQWLEDRPRVAPRPGLARLGSRL